MYPPALAVFPQDDERGRLCTFCPDQWLLFYTPSIQATGMFSIRALKGLLAGTERTLLMRLWQEGCACFWSGGTKRFFAAIDVTLVIKIGRRSHGLELRDILKDCEVLAFQICVAVAAWPHVLFFCLCPVSLLHLYLGPNHPLFSCKKKVTFIFLRRTVSKNTAQDKANRKKRDPPPPPPQASNWKIAYSHTNCSSRRNQKIFIAHRHRKKVFVVLVSCVWLQRTSLL